jgi:hypothetical protein
MTIDEIRADIVAACEEFQAAGYLLVQGTYATLKDEPCGGCALTAVAFVHGGIVPKDNQAHRVLAFAGKRYGWNEKQCEEFINGYDSNYSAEGELGTLGDAVRVEVMPTEVM